MLGIDVAVVGAAKPRATLVVSSGLHGVEGFWGSALQVQALQSGFCDELSAGMATVFVHGLNPYGFAYLRRVNENNIDPNRNFLLPPSRYQGASPAYANLDPLLNPARPPSLLDGLRFYIESCRALSVHGMASLSQAIAEGQYEYEKGLFFGGAGLSESGEILRGHFARWTGDAPRVLHLDLHTGLGPRGQLTLLCDDAVGAAHADWIQQHFEGARFQPPDRPSDAYQAKGTLGQWCRALVPNAEYLYLCAEAGTYPALRMLAALQAENQAHHWAPPGSAVIRAAKRRLLERFCPRSQRWRAQVLTRGMALLRQAQAALEGACWTSQRASIPR